MGYLICERCEGYYKLNEGELPEDFERCQCGGKLDYVEEFEIDENESNLYVNDSLTEKQRSDKGIEIYNKIKHEEKYSYLEKRDQKIKSHDPKNLVTNSAVIILTFTIFPIEFGLIYSYLPFTLMAVIALILSGLLYYFQRTQKVNTFREMKRIYALCGLYFVSFTLLFLLWAFQDIMKFLDYFISNPLYLTVVPICAIVFSQKFFESVANNKITDPLATLGQIKTWIYYLIVFTNVLYFIVMLGLGIYLTH